MKTKFVFFILLSGYLAFGQATVNQSFGSPQTLINNPAPLGQQFGTEIYRFRSGFISQLDAGNNFGFTNSRWFAMGRVPAGTQTFYGLRFQMENRGLVMGYNNLTAVNPVIQWIGTGSNLGNLEFRVASAFGAPGTPAPDLLIATMKSNGNTVFSQNNSFVNSSLITNAKVAIENTGQVGLYIGSSSNSSGTTGFEVAQSSGITQNIGGIITVQGLLGNNPISNIGLIVNANGEDIQAIGIRATTAGNAFFQAAIEGTTINNNGNQFAGFFNGDVYISGSYGPSDAKLKDNVKQENTVLGKLAKLKPVSYDYKKMPELNLPQGIQHGFIAQELAAVFPELTKDIKKPILDKEGKQTSIFEFKSVNYNGLISVLTAGINELSQELQLLKEEINTLKDSIASGTTSKSSSLENTGGAFMEQNIPNPFADQTTIRYQLPNSTNTAAIIVCDLNGLLIKSYPINSNQSELTIKASDVGRGLFIYCLVQNGQQLLTKKMIVQ